MNNKVKMRRLELGMSQEQLVEISGVGRTVISQLENESREVVTSETMLKISRALKCSAADIFLLE